MRRHAYELIALTAIATAALALAVPAGAQGMGGGMTQSTHQEFSKLDTDKDGNVTKKEAAPNKELSKRFEELDANRDGKLNQGEFAKFETQGEEGQPEGQSPLERPER